jgi:hypothetical protein
VREGVSEDGVHDICLIEIELPLIDLRFPADPDVCRSWGCTDWWYFLLKFADQFTDDEIQRCGGLGMPVVVIAALDQLDRGQWPAEMEAKYLAEVEAVTLHRAVVEMERAEAKEQGQLEVLIGIFLKQGFLDDDWWLELEATRWRCVQVSWKLFAPAT